MNETLRVVGAITHTDETTLELCRAALANQSSPVAKVVTVSNVSPAYMAFNQCLDFAFAEDADVLVHVASDCILGPDAVARMAKRFNPVSTSVVTARGFDVMNGEGSPVGAWLLNMRLIRDRFRFRDVFKMDLDFTDRLEQATGSVRSKSKRGWQIGYHHPIWLPREIYQKFRYNTPKYRNKDVKKHLDFFERCLAVNPHNKVLKAGLMALKRGAAEPHDLGCPIRGGFSEEWEWVKGILEIQGNEFFAYHEDFIEIARQLLGSDQDIKPMAPPFFPRASATKAPAIPGKVRAIDRIIHFVRPIYRALPQPAVDAAKLAFRRPAARNVDVRELPMAPQEPKPIAPQKPKHVAIGEGRRDWENRWDRAATSKRVLLIAPKDFAGSMCRWAESINRYTDFAARLITFEHHQYDNPVDLVVPDGGGRAKVYALIEQAAVIHLKDEHSWFLDGERRFKNRDLLTEVFFSPRFASKPKVFTHYGGYARLFKDNPRYIEAVQGFDARIAMTPDLNYPWFDGAFIPHAIDVDCHEYKWSDANMFAHSPLSPEKEATYLFEESLLELDRRHRAIWQDWSTDLIHGVSFSECIARKQSASLFFDQAGRHRQADLGIDDVVGWYGNSAIEAMAFGIPTMAHLSEAGFRQAAAAGVDLSGIPIINIERTRESMVASFLKFANATPQERAEISKRTREFTAKFHGYESCGTRLAAVYEGVLATKREAKVNVFDITDGAPDDLIHIRFGGKEVGREFFESNLRGDGTILLANGT